MSNRFVFILVDAAVVGGSRPGEVEKRWRRRRGRLIEFAAIRFNWVRDSVG